MNHNSNDDAGVARAEDLHQFANFLKEAEERLSALMSQCIRELDRVNQSWNDRKQAEFTDRFNEALDSVGDLADLMAEHSRYVHFKGNQIDDYANS